MPAPARAAAPDLKPISDEHARTFWAHPKRKLSVRSKPSPRAKPRAQVRQVTLSGTPEVVLVLARSRGEVGSARHGGRWTLIRYPGLDERTGWVRTRDLTTPRRVSTRLVIDRRSHEARLYRRGRLVFRTAIGVGAGGSPTPRGRYYVRERLVPAAGSIYGALAFGLSAFSRYRTDWPGGGQVGVHGTNEPGLIPGYISNGCVRLRNAAILSLGRRMPVGTPVLIT